MRQGGALFKSPEECYQDFKNRLKSITENKGLELVTLGVHKICPGGGGKALVSMWAQWLSWYNG